VWEREEMVNCRANKFDMAYFLRLIKVKADEMYLTACLHSEEFVKCVNKITKKNTLPQTLFGKSNSNSVFDYIV